MTPRSIRRAAERKARKLARKAEKQFFMQAATAVPEPEMPFPAIEPDLERPALPAEPPSDEAAPFSEPKVQPDEAAPFSEPKIQLDEAARFSEPQTQRTPSSPARLAANRANAQLSTGPRSAAGKEVSKLNAVKTGLTGRTVLLPTDDVAAYEHHVREFMKELKPVGIREQCLAQSIADNMWRVLRIPALESAIFSRGYTEFAGQFENEDPGNRPALIECHAFLTYQKQIRNLQLQEARLQRQRAKDMAELRQLQQERIQKEKQQMEAAAELYLAARKDNQPFDPAAFGFVFSTAEIESHLKRARAAHLAREQRKALVQAA
ncbi:MAG TPA: hypothetical protein VF283_17805 [Bryobacteraceae bacterium]